MSRSTSESKPPLGIVPKYIKAQQRIEEIAGAIVRYNRNEPPLDIPVDWLMELSTLCNDEVCRRSPRIQKEYCAQEKATDILSGICQTSLFNKQ